MGSFNLIKVLLWAIFTIVVLLTNITEQKSLYKPIQPENGNIARTGTFENNWPLYYRRVLPTSDGADDDIVDAGLEHDKKIKTLMEEIVAKSRLADSVESSMMENDNLRLKANRKDDTLEYKSEEQEEMKSKSKKNSINATKEHEEKIMNDMSEAKLTNKENKEAVEEVMTAPIKCENKIENKEALSENFDNNQELKLKAQSFVADNDDINTKAKPVVTTSGTIESKETTTAFFVGKDIQNNASLIYDNDENKTKEKILEEKNNEHQTTMERLKDPKPILNEDKSNESKLAQSINNENVINFKDLKVNKPLIESTENHTDNKKDEVGNDLKDETSNLTTMESLNELQQILNEENSEKFQQTQKETLKPILNEKKSEKLEPTQQETSSSENINELKPVSNKEKSENPQLNQQESLDTKNVPISKERQDSMLKNPAIESTENKDFKVVNDFPEEISTQATLESLKLLSPIFDEEFQLYTDNVMNSKELENALINKLLIESTPDHTENEDYIPLNTLKEKNASQSTKESLNEVKPILNEEKSEKLQTTQQETLNSENITNSMEAADTQINKPLNESIEVPTENKKDVVANKDTPLKEPQIVKFINFTITSDSNNIRQAEEIIATKQNDVVLKIQLDELQEKGPDIKKIGQINEEPAEVVLNEAEGGNIKHDAEVKPLRLSDEEKNLGNEESVVRKEGLENSSDSEQSFTYTTKASEKNSLKNEEGILLDNEKNISELNKNIAETTSGDKTELTTKTTGHNLVSKDSELKENVENVTAVLTYKLPEASINANENQTSKEAASKEETNGNVFNQTNFIVKENVSAGAATDMTNKEVSVTTTEASIEHVLEQPSSMIKKNELEEITAVPLYIVNAASTTEAYAENAMEPTNFKVKQNDAEKEEATTKPTQVFSNTEGVMKLTEIQKFNSFNKGEKVATEKLENEIKIEESMQATNLADTQLLEEETTEQYYKNATQVKEINDETMNGEQHTMISTEFSPDSKNEMNLQKLSTGLLIEEVTMKPLAENSPNAEISLIPAEDIKNKFNFTSTEVFDVNSMSISEYVSKILEALKPAIEAYDRKQSNTTKFDVMQSFVNNVNSSEIVKEPLQIEPQNLQNTPQGNRTEYTYKESDGVTPMNENYVTKELQKLSSAIEDSSELNMEVESSKLQTIVEEGGLEEPLKENIQFTKDHRKASSDSGSGNEESKTKVPEVPLLSENEPVVTLENSNFKMESEQLKADENSDNFQTELERTTDNAKEGSNVTKFSEVDIESLKQDPLNAESMQQTIKYNAEMKFSEKEILENPKTTVKEELKNDMKETLEETAHVSDEAMENKQMTMKESETIFTGNKSPEASLGSEEKLEESSDNNKNQIIINTEENINTKIDEEFNVQTKEVLAVSPLVEAAAESTTNENKNTEISLSSEEELKDSADKNKNQTIMNTEEKENVVKGDESNDQTKEETMTGNKNTVTSLGPEENIQASSIDIKHEMNSNTLNITNKKIFEELNGPIMEVFDKTQVTTGNKDTKTFFSDNINEVSNNLDKQNTVEWNEPIKEVFDKMIVSDSVPESTTTSMKNTEASLSLEEMPADTSENNKSQISNNAVEEDNKEKNNEHNDQTQEETMTENNNTVTSLGTEEKLEVSSVDNKNEVNIVNITNQKIFEELNVPIMEVFDKTQVSTGNKDTKTFSSDKKKEVSNTVDKQNTAELNEPIKAVFDKMILSDAASESTTTSMKNTEASLSLVEVPADTSENNKSQISNNAENITNQKMFEELNKPIMEVFDKTQVTTGNKDTKTFSSDNKKEVSNTVDKPNTKIVEELKEPIDEVFDKKILSDAITESTTTNIKKTETSLSLEEMSKNISDNNNSQISNKTVEEEGNLEELNDQTNELITNGNKDTETPFNLEGKLEDSSVGNKNEIKFNTLDIMHKNIFEELNEPIMEVFDKTKVSDAVLERITNGNTLEKENEKNVYELNDQTKELTTSSHKDTEALWSLEEKLKDSSVDNKNEISINPIDITNKKIFEELNEQIEEVFDKTKKAETVPESIRTNFKKTETPLNLEKMPEASFDNNEESQISNKSVEQENGANGEDFNDQTKEVTTTGIKNIETSSSLQEKLEDPFVDNKNEISITTVDKLSTTKNVEELKEEIKEAFEKPSITNAESKKNTVNNTKTTTSSEKEQEETADNSNNQSNYNVIDKKNRKSDEQEVNGNENSKQVFKLENSMKNTETVKTEEQKESIESTIEKIHVNNTTPTIITTVPLTSTTNEDYNKIEKTIQPSPLITGETINHQNKVQNNENPQNLLIKTDETNDEHWPKEPNFDNYDKNRPLVKSTEIKKINEDVTTTITCITTSEPDSLRNVEKNTRQTIKSNELKTVENNAKLTADAGNDDAGDNEDKQLLADELSPELKFVTWQTYTDNKFKGYPAEELTGKNQQNLQSIVHDNHDADNDDADDADDGDNDGDDDYDDDEDGDDGEEDDDEEDDDDDENGDIDVAHHVVQNFDEINDGQNENTNINVEVADAFTGKLTANGVDKHKTDVSANYADGEVVKQEQANDFDGVINDPHLSSSIKHYRIDDNANGNRKNLLDQMKEMAQMEQHYPDTTPYNAEQDIISEADELPTKTSTTTATKKSATPTTTNWWSTLQYEEIRKFLNTIFYAAADDIYREIARKAKEAQLREAKKIEEDHQRKTNGAWKPSNEWSLS